MTSAISRLACFLAAILLASPADLNAKELTGAQLIKKERKLKKKYRVHQEHNGFRIAQQLSLIHI